MNCKKCKVNNKIRIILPCNHIYCIECSKQIKKFICLECGKKFEDELPVGLKILVSFFK